MKTVSKVKCGLLLLAGLVLAILARVCGGAPSTPRTSSAWDTRPIPLLCLPKLSIGAPLPDGSFLRAYILTLDAHMQLFLGYKLTELGEMSARIHRWKEMEGGEVPAGPGPLTPLLSPWKPEDRNAQVLIALDPALRFAQAGLLLSACRSAGLPDAALVARRVSPPVAGPEKDDNPLFSLRLRDLDPLYMPLDGRQLPLCSVAINFRTSTQPVSCPRVELTAHGSSPALPETDAPRQAEGLKTEPEKTGTGVICIHPRDDATVAAFFRVLEESARKGYQAVLVDLD